jgi:holo-[acyl-carrier protein] synthase
MIHGIGIDMVEVSRIKKSLSKYAEKFEKKLFTFNEIDYCRRKADPNKHFAARFAVKEAALKSLGTGISNGIGWKDIEVVNDPDSGKPNLKISGRAKEVYDSLGLKSIHISISHDAGFAIAQAIAER